VILLLDRCILGVYLFIRGQIIYNAHIRNLHTTAIHIHLHCVLVSDELFGFIKIQMV
jgi:hypothetical protein